MNLLNDSDIELNSKYLTIVDNKLIAKDDIPPHV